VYRSFQIDPQAWQASIGVVPLAGIIGGIVGCMSSSPQPFYAITGLGVVAGGLALPVTSVRAILNKLRGAKFSSQMLERGWGRTLPDRTYGVLTRELRFLEASELRSRLELAEADLATAKSRVFELGARLRPPGAAGP
jgi:hypothetical protein